MHLAHFILVPPVDIQNLDFLSFSTSIASRCKCEVNKMELRWANGGKLFL